MIVGDTFTSTKQRVKAAATNVKPLSVTGLPQSLSVFELLVVFTFATLLMHSRMPDRLDGFLWAEDGVIFVAQAYSRGIHSIFQPYAGYLHVLPRLITWAYSHLGNPESIPKAFAWITTILTGCSVTYIGAVASRYLPRLAAVALALTPLAVLNSGEVWTSVTNLQWVLAPLVAVMLWEMTVAELNTDVRSKITIAKAIVLLVLMMTGPFGVIFGTFAIAAIARRIASRKRTPDRARMLAFLSGFVVQGCVLAFCPSRYKIPPLHPITDFVHFPWVSGLLRFMLIDFAGVRSALMPRPPVWIVAAILLTGVVIVTAYRSGTYWRSVSLGMLAVALMLWVLGVVRSDAPDMDVATMLHAQRYSYLPYVFISWSLIVNAATADQAWVKSLSLLVVGMAFLGSIAMWQCPPVPQAHIENIGGGSYLVHMPPSDKWNFTFTVH